MIKIKPSKEIKPGKILFASFLILILALSSGCAEKEKVHRVGVLCGLNFFTAIGESFKEEMTKLGYIEGENIIYDFQKTNFEPGKEKQILERFVEDDVDLIFVFPTEVALAAKEATKGTDIPVVFASAFTEGNDLIDSINQPGGHVTGVRYPGTDVAVKRLEILHEIMPNAERVWLPYQDGYPASGKICHTGHEKQCFHLSDKQILNEAISMYGF